MKRLLIKVLSISISWMPSVLIICAALCLVAGLFAIAWKSISIGLRLIVTAVDFVILAFLADFIGGKHGKKEK